MNHHALLNTAFKEVRQCCQHILQGYDRLNSAKPSKEDREQFISSIDADVQHVLISQLKEYYPTHKFVAEEPSSEASQQLPEHDNVWVIDPIDGSNNYMHHIPFFAVSICYYSQGEAKAALVYDPINDELFTAIEGKGALLNQRRIYSSHCKELSEAVCGIEGRSGHHQNIESQVRTTRKLGCTSLTLCYAACGRFDLSVCEKPHLWDIAAGLLIAKEAGLVLYNEAKEDYQLDDAYLYTSTLSLKKQV
ncbi:inositol monophosphatase family protein [Candidatus Synchoanobacter obligatus]|uniref:Inositol-1-monophosphatase n=1 Tax=Candidatus Synchoanobacter obligatus TaxID=2919597 RepID=A0ABT1L3F1_9GAMM|nr:inositol monophosphatase family protein [Candidatus Synchoanobacter obligatus]MCP8351752.1 inositol monophosphatase [Candidatus Synchoanobacter obligatus]